VELTLADGSTKEKATDGSGIVELEEIPPGPVKVKLPELGTPNDEADPPEAPQNTRTTVATKTPDGAPLTTIATGSAWRVAAGLPSPSHGQ
jgi:hypothetical protein